MARRKTLYSLLDLKKKTGISYPTLVNYARDFADQIPAVGQGRNRRYTVESIKAFERIYEKRRPGRRPGADWVKHPPGSVATVPGGTAALNAARFSSPKRTGSCSGRCWRPCVEVAARLARDCPPALSLVLAVGVGEPGVEPHSHSEGEIVTLDVGGRNVLRVRVVSWRKPAPTQRG